MSRFLYALLMWLVALLLPIKLLWRARLQPAYLAHWRERYGYYTQRVTAPVLWLHCVSVGETRAAQPLVNALLADYPQHQVLITHGTPTGRATSTQLFNQAITQGRVLQAYLPVDLPCAVHRFLNYFSPQWGGLMETEIWFALIAGAKRKHIPMALVSARLSEKSAKGYAKLAPLTQQGLQQLAWIAAQTEADAERFKTLGAVRVSVCGNLKFDVTPPPESQIHGHALRHWLGTTRTVMMAASTREGEETLILDALKQGAMGLETASTHESAKSETTPSNALLTLMVPRHPQRFEEVEALLKNRGIRYVRRSSLHLQETSATFTPLAPEIQVVLGDSMGEMYTYYAASDFALMGGSLQPLGGQNLIEAACMGVPTLLGPHMFNFAHASLAAVAAGAAIQVSDIQSLATWIQRIAQQPETRDQMSAAAKAFSLAHRGTTQRLLEQIKAHLV